MKSLMFVTALLAGCSSQAEQAAKHVVIAELVQREGVAEDHVAIRAVRFASAEEAEVDARILEGGRAGVWRDVHCRLRRAAQRWVME